MDNWLFWKEPFAAVLVVLGMVFWLVGQRELKRSGKRKQSKCPFCAGKVPWARLDSKTFLCPTCNAPLRVAESNGLLGYLFLAAGWPVAFIVAGRMGLKGNTLLFGGFIGGFVVGVLLTTLVGSIAGSLIRPRLEPDPGPGLSDGGVLHIESPPKFQKPPD